jgi:F-type H+-transporting ATPase subunit epsilon
MSELLVRIVTAKGVILEEEAQMATLPALDGEVGILPEHIPSIFELTEGCVRVHKAGESVKEIEINGGFARVYENSVSIVTTVA